MNKREVFEETVGMSQREGSVVAFIEEVEGLLLAAGLGQQRPELMALLPPCERAFVEGDRWRGSLDVLWSKAQRLRRMFGRPEAEEDKRSCVGMSDRCSGCDTEDPERLEALERICADYRFSEWDKWRRRYPYGVWTCEDGKQVLFNRKYESILQRSPGGYVVDWPEPQKEQVNFVKEAWFYGDDDSPRHCDETRDRLRKVVKAFHEGRDVEEYAKHGGKS